MIGPVGRDALGLAWDPERGTVVLFGGEASGVGYLSDTWEWNGEAWTQKEAQPPTACDHMKMVYDASTEATFLFSGLDPSESLVQYPG